jgi:hypothetical protein
MQIKPRKSKEMQIKKLAFPWIPLAELGLFKGLWRIQVKNSSSPLPFTRHSSNAFNNHAPYCRVADRP